MKQNFKKSVTFLLIFLALFSQLSYGQTTDNYQVRTANSIVLYKGSYRAMVNNVERHIDDDLSITPITENDRTMVPFRFVAEGMGAQVNWIPETKQIIMTLNNDVIEMQLGSKVMKKNGEEFPSDVAPFTRNGRTYVPIRIITEKFGRNVFYDRNLIIISDVNTGFDKNNDKSLVDALIAQLDTNRRLTEGEISKLFSDSVVIVKAIGMDNRVSAQGSGFYIGEGVFVTNYSVINPSYRVQIETKDGQIFDVEGTISSDLISNLSLIKTKKKPNLKPVRLGFNSSYKVGHPAFIIGSPNGLRNTVSLGVISGIKEEYGVGIIQNTAFISDRDAGSPLVDIYGNVIGINNLGKNGGFNYAVSIDRISHWYDRIKKLSFDSINIMGNENYTKDSSISDEEIMRTITNMVNANNSEDINKYSQAFYYETSTDQANDKAAIASIYKEFDVRMELKTSSIIKKSKDETLVRVQVEYTEINEHPSYKDHEIQALYYLRNVNGKWKIYRADVEYLLRISHRIS